MAIGRRDIGDITEYVMYMSSRSDVMRKDLEIFEDVVNNLEKWANETEIGNEDRENLRKLNFNIEKFLNGNNGIKMLISQIVEFCRKQEDINASK